MKRWLLFGILFLGLAALLSNSTRVESWLLAVRKRHAEKERRDLVENWEVHFDAELDRMREEAHGMRSRLVGSQVKVEKTRIELAALRKDQGDYDRLIREFTLQLKAGQTPSGVSRADFVFAGRSFDSTGAASQLERYVAEMAALEDRIEHLARLHEAQLAVAAGMAQALAAAEKRIDELATLRETYALQEQILSVKNEIRRTEALARESGTVSSGPAGERMSVLVAAMRNAALQSEAELRVASDADAGLSATSLSLARTAQELEECARRDRVGEITRRYMEEPAGDR